MTEGARGETSVTPITRNKYGDIFLGRRLIRKTESIGRIREYLPSINAHLLDNPTHRVYVASGSDSHFPVGVTLKKGNGEMTTIVSIDNGRDVYDAEGHCGTYYLTIPSIETGKPREALIFIPPLR